MSQRKRSTRSLTQSQPDENPKRKATTSNKSNNTSSQNSSTTNSLPSSSFSSQPDSKIGKIKRIHCKNFITYQDCSLEASDFLNIIIGPNGTGKSTIVSAIVLCLGGEPATLYRATDIREYIKNGKSEAIISVEIYCSSKTKSKGLSVLEFTRSFDVSGKSVYKVNQETVSRKKYMEIITEYKIQVTNLCQFLPQDRVQDFAKMNPKEIFENTLKSVCEDEDIKKFNDLKELSKEHQNKGKSMDDLAKTLKEANNRLQELETAVGRFKSRNEFEQKVKVCKAKKLWLNVNEQEEKLKAVEESMKPALKAFQVAKSNYEKEIKMETKIQDESQKLKREEKDKKLKLEQMREKVQRSNNELHQIKEKLHQADSRYQNELREVKDLEMELENESRLLEACTQDVKNAETKYANDKIDENYKAIERKMLEKKEQISKLIKERAAINNRLDEDYNPNIQMLKRKLERLENLNETKLNNLKEKFRDVYAGVMWLKENRHSFKGNVYDPMILELNVINPNNAKYFENTISHRDLLAFTCEQKADVSRLTDELCIKRKLAVNIAFSKPATECTYKAEQPIRNLEKYGFHSYLIDLIDGPVVILNYLCSIYSLHKIPVGSIEVTNHTDSIPTNIRQYYGDNQRFTVTISKYTKEPSVMQTTIAPKNILQSLDTQQVNYIKHEISGLLKKSDHLKNERSKLEAKITEIEYSYKEMRQQKTVLDHQRINLNQLKQKLNKQSHKVENLRSQVESNQNLKENYMKNKKNLIINMDKVVNTLLESMQTFREAYRVHAKAAVKILLFQRENENLIERITFAKEDKEKAEKVLYNFVDNKDKIKQKLEKLLKEALEATNNETPSSRKFPYKKEFSELSDDIEELREVLNEYLARLECMGNVDSSIMDEYKAKKEQVEALASSIQQTKENELNCLNKMKEMYTNWYPLIANIVDSLNRQFSKFMSALKYVGEINLIRQNEMDFESYGMQIMVKYREKEQLQPLDRSRQSGGERAVAIAVYSLALQHLTHVPFRCVDEINQGMDATNERKICEMLIEETTKDGMSQYFFVTPKLLNGLSSNERVTVHTVFNCQLIEKDTAFRFNL